MNNYREVQLDGLIGPTHHYAGLSHGNVACMQNAHTVANPKEAALQGLAKMKFVADLGIPQMVMPPLIRPDLAFLHDMGFEGELSYVLDSAYKTAPELLAAAFSASSMWVANAATVAPSPDTPDSKVHFTPANLQSKIHRSIEVKQTSQLLKKLFPDPAHFVHHEPLPATPYSSDEGAANHMRICEYHGGVGHHIFVYGKLQSAGNASKIYEPRQAKEASDAVARLHGLAVDSWVTIQQNPAAIDSGVFHNDVISMNNESLLVIHQSSFIDNDSLLEFINKQSLGKCIHCIEVLDSDVPLNDAVSTYLFNSQLLTLPEGGMLLLMPAECAEHEGIAKLTHAWLDDEANPISRVETIDVRESMKNGGGPACLRLRIVMNEAERAAVHQGAVLTDTLYSSLTEWVGRHYRDCLTLQDLTDPAFTKEVHDAIAELHAIMAI